MKQIEIKISLSRWLLIPKYRYYYLDRKSDIDWLCLHITLEFRDEDNGE